MKTNWSLAAVVSVLSIVEGGFAISARSNDGDGLEIATALRRALPNSPGGYTPSYVNCPSTPPSVRNASSLSKEEISWLERRRNKTLPAMQSFLDRMNIPDFDVGSYFQAHSKNTSALPNIGIAFSGGGWRALQTGAGVVEAFDSRTEHSTDPGHLGGLLQSSTYLAGLSGGSWLLGSLFMNNFTTVTALRDNPSGAVWQFDNSIFKGPEGSGLQSLDTLEYWRTITDEIEAKEDAGFEITITDLWGRALSYQLINATNGGPAYTWSSIAQSSGFQNGETPFPVVIADERAPGQTVVPTNTTIYEFNPFEMGTWDPTAYGFIPTQYLGTNFTAGQVSSSQSQCVVGFDNAGFIMGTSSSIFNQVLVALKSSPSSSSIPSILITLLLRLIPSSTNNVDIADYAPNPFYKYRASSNSAVTNPSVDSTTLQLVDGSADNQNIPLHPLIQPARHVDVIFAVDASSDTDYNWPDGFSLVATQERNQDGVAIANGTRFPHIPDVNTFINLGLNKRPTLFGCNLTDSSSTHPPPLIVYLPNAPYSTYSNVSTFDLSYSDSQRDAFITNGYNVATMANATLSGYKDWGVCVACAVLKRSWQRTGESVPDRCVSCWDKYCWNGETNDTAPAKAKLEPGLILG